MIVGLITWNPTQNYKPEQDISLLSVYLLGFHLLGLARLLLDVNY